MEAGRAFKWSAGRKKFRKSQIPTRRASARALSWQRSLWTKKKSVQIRYPLGFERVVKAAIENFRKMGLEPVIARTPASFAEGRRVFRLGFFGGAVNRQFDYDHENDKALYLDKKYVHRMLECRKNAWEEYKDMAVVHAGPRCHRSIRRRAL